MTTTVFLLAAVTAAVSVLMAWREARRRLDERDTYVSPITMFRRELSLAGICTIAAVVIWAAVVPSSVRLAAIALFPTFLYIFMVTGKRPDE